MMMMKMCLIVAVAALSSPAVECRPGSDLPAPVSPGGLAAFDISQSTLPVQFHILRDYTSNTVNKVKDFRAEHKDSLNDFQAILGPAVQLSDDVIADTVHVVQVNSAHMGRLISDIIKFSSQMGRDLGPLMGTMFQPPKYESNSVADAPVASAPVPAFASASASRPASNPAARSRKHRVGN